MVRRDQGGDTVSEGQAYALVIASALDDDATFELVWGWTGRHLMQANGLPAWRMDARGRLSDTQSASDADVLIAWALLRDDGPGREEHNAEGRRIAEAALRQEVIFTGDGTALLAAGPWALSKRSVNVSYWTSFIFDDLSRLTQNPTWSVLADQVPQLLGQLTDQGKSLPSDWAQLTDDVLRPSSSPLGVASSPSAQPQYGLDAQRAVVWSAVSCRPEEKSFAAQWYSLLRYAERGSSTTLALNGDVLNGSPHPMPLVASAAAAGAAGDESSQESRLESAEKMYAQDPTFYGAAWIALGRMLLETNKFHACEE